jgi:steroid delta-isomerase-like uncharacterized protein
MSARETMSGYFEALVQRGDFVSFFTEDVRFSFEGTDQSGTGREGIEQAIRFMHEQAFDARPELKNLIVEDEKAAIEADFVGVHIGDFAGVPATGRSIRVPYSAVYDLEKGDAIKAVRIYMPMQSLVDQLGAMPATAAGST